MNAKIIKKKDQIKELIRAERLFNEGQPSEALKIIEDIEKRDDLTATSRNKCIILKSDYFSKIGRFEDSIKLAEKAYKESQKLNDKKQSFESLLPIARSFLFIGKLKRGFEKLEICKELLKTLTGKSEEIKRLDASLGLLFGLFYSHTGDIRQSVQYTEQALTLAREIDHKALMLKAYNNLGGGYRTLGDLDRALEYAERGFLINEEYFNRINPFLLTTLIEIYIDKNDLEKAENYLNRLEKLNQQENNNIINQFYRGSKAIILKSTPRARNLILAEDLFRQIIDEEIINFEAWVNAIINLCDLLLVELRMTNLIEIVDEIRPLIRRLLEIAEEKHSNWLIVEAYILYAKLSLLTFNIKQAKRFLTQAQQIAKRYGLNQLATKISDEYKDLLKKSNLWEKLEENNAPMSERLELARLNEQIEEIIRSRTTLTAYIREEKVTISKETKICLVCKGEVFGFSYICKCGANYCENCAQALKNLENRCWACDIPIVYSKFAKSFK